MYCWFLGISVNYVGLTSPPTTCEQRLVTSLMHRPSKCPWFKDTSVYRCFERFQASFSRKARGRSSTSSYLPTGRGAYGRRDTLAALYSVSVQRGELTGATELRGRIRSSSSLFCLLVSLVFLCVSGTPVSRLQRSRQNF